MHWLSIAVFALVPQLSPLRSEQKSSPPPQPLCSLGGGPPAFSIARTQNIVSESSVIVRAKSLGDVPPPSGTPRPDLRYVAFAVEEVLRGSDVPDTLHFGGTIRDEDAIPPEAVEDVPHLSYIRRWGGDCLAMTYRSGGQYLLLLQYSEERGTLDPYWSVLAPTNNEVSGPDDPWIGWVRSEIARNPVRP
jgi:hypothetical protein